MNISAFSLQGKRSHMEDFFDIGYQLKPKDELQEDEWPYEYFYLGIFDGHGGCDAAKFAKENLLKFITAQPEFWSDNDDDILRSIQIGFAETHESMRKVMHQWPRTQKYLPSTAGTTASILFIKNGKYYTGHVGDSRIVISRRDQTTKQWISKQITEDHKPESEVELARIRRAGGDVKEKVGVHRVVWRRPVLVRDFDAFNQYMMSDQQDGPIPHDNHPRADQIASYPISESLVSSYQVIPFLAIARSLGDLWSINPISGQYIISPEPDVECRPIDPDDVSILLATDGLWSVVSSTQAVRALEEFKAVRENERDNGPYAKQYFTIDNYYNVTRPVERDNYALSLVYLAYQVWERRGLRSDNITAVVAMLQDILRPLQNVKHCYNTRSSLTKKTSADLCNNKIVQIERTRNYSEAIPYNQPPTFNIEPIETEDMQTLERLGNWLMLPPSVLPKVKGMTMIPPRNFIKLEKAQVRRLRHPREWGHILVRKVSDDPQDEMLQPERSNKRGKDVRDASAQCTQSIYDFSRSWPGEGWDDDNRGPQGLRYDEDEDEYYLDLDDLLVVDEFDEDSSNDDEEDGDDDELVLEGEDEDDEDDAERDLSEPRGDKMVKDDNDEEDDVDDDDNDDIDYLNLISWESDGDQQEDSSTRPNTRRRSKELMNTPSKDHMLQPRSDNCDGSPVRRKTRSGAFLSLTGGPKRKLIHELPKNKRRKSHPMQSTVAQS